MAETLKLRPDFVDIEAWQGDDFEVTMNLRDQATGQPVDISAYTFTGHIRSGSADSGAAIEITLSCTVTDGPNGVMQASATAAQTADLNGAYRYDIQGAVAGGIRTYLAGTVRFGSEVTR